MAPKTKIQLTKNITNPFDCFCFARCCLPCSELRDAWFATLYPMYSLRALCAGFAVLDFFHSKQQFYIHNFNSFVVFINISLYINVRANIVSMHWPTSITGETNNTLTSTLSSLNHIYKYIYLLLFCSYFLDFFTSFILYFSRVDLPLLQRKSFSCRHSGTRVAVLCTEAL